MRRRLFLSNALDMCAVVLVGTIVSSGILGCKHENSKTPEKQKIVLRTEDEARAFVSEELSKPIPPDYQVPGYISSGLPVAQVYDSLKQRFPDFYGKEHEQFLQAIMADPETYLKLSVESKAIRRYYDENSRY